MIIGILYNNYNNKIIIKYIKTIIYCPELRFNNKTIKMTSIFFTIGILKINILKSCIPRVKKNPNPK